MRVPARLQRAEQWADEWFRSRLLVMLRLATPEEAEEVVRVKDAHDAGRMTAADRRSLEAIMAALLDRAVEKGRIDL